MPLKPSNATLGCVQWVQDGQGTAPVGSNHLYVWELVPGFSDWAVDGRRAQCTHLLVVPGVLLVAVQTPGSRISLGRLRRCWNDTSFCLTLILVASAVLAGWTKHLLWSCVCCMLPVLLNWCGTICGYCSDVGKAFIISNHAQMRKLLVFSWNGF